MLNKIIFGIAIFIGTNLTPIQAQNSYDKDQDGTISFFEEASSKALASQATDINTRYIHHLTGVYLYCLLKNGSCPLVLDAILEIDIANSAISGESQCKNMVAFWRKWIANGFEERVDYNLSTGHLNRYNEFKSLFRSKYIKCTDTVKSALVGLSDKNKFLTERYSQNSSASKLIKKLADFLKLIKNREANIFTATGAYKNSTEQSAQPKKAGKK